MTTTNQVSPHYRRAIVWNACRKIAAAHYELDAKKLHSTYTVVTARLQSFTTFEQHRLTTKTATNLINKVLLAHANHRKLTDTTPDEALWLTETARWLNRHPAYPELTQGNLYQFIKTATQIRAIAHTKGVNPKLFISQERYQLALVLRFILQTSHPIKTAPRS